MEILIKPIKQPTDLLTPLSSGLVLTSSNGNITIGRDDSCDLTLSCKNKVISRKHVQIIQYGQSYQLTDLSANGTFTNRSKLPLGRGNSIRFDASIIINIGDFILELHASKPRIETPSVSAVLKRAQALKNTKAIPASKPKKNKERAPRADINEAFIPPSVTIPEDWNASFKSKKSTQRKHPSTQINQLIDHSTYDSQLLNSLLKGLGLNDEHSRRSLNNENMVAIGRSLRVSIAGIIKQAEHVERIKSIMCLDEKNSLKAFNYSPFGNISSSEEFLAELLKKKKTYSHLPLEIARCQKEITEDYAVILTSYNKAIDDFREELSPFAIESEFQSQTSVKTGLSAKILPSLGKWQTYKLLWSKKCLNFKKLIKKNFEENIKQVHIKRVNQRPVNTKKQ